MNDIMYTCRTRLLPHKKDGEDIIAIRLNNTDTHVHHIPGEVINGLKVSADQHFMTGPVADKLHAYEVLGYSPEELKQIIRELRFRRYAINTTYGITRPDFVYADTDSIKVAEDYIRKDIELTKAAYKKLVEYHIHEKQRKSMEIEKVIFHDPATIVFWADGSKTVVKATNEEYDPEKGLAMAISKRALGDKGNYFDVFKKHLKEVK